MKSNKKNIARKTPYISTGNVLDDLGFSPPEKAALKLKMDLHAEILKVIEKKNLTARALEGILNQPQPRISELLRGKISNISAEKLAGYLSLLGVAIKITPRNAA